MNRLFRTSLLYSTPPDIQTFRPIVVQAQTPVPIPAAICEAKTEHTQKAGWNQLVTFR